MSHLVDTLRALARSEHSDLSVAADAADELEQLYCEADGLLDNNLLIWATCNKLRAALREIALMETGRANATVCRMAAKAREALGDVT
jgi:hypothetical protein